MIQTNGLDVEIINKGVEYLSENHDDLMWLLLGLDIAKDTANTQADNELLLSRIKRIWDNICGNSNRKIAEFEKNTALAIDAINQIIKAMHIGQQIRDDKLDRMAKKVLDNDSKINSIKVSLAKLSAKVSEQGNRIKTDMFIGTIKEHCRTEGISNLANQIVCIAINFAELTHGKSEKNDKLLLGTALDNLGVRDSKVIWADIMNVIAVEYVSVLMRKTHFITQKYTPVLSAVSSIGYDPGTRYGRLYKDVSQWQGIDLHTPKDSLTVLTHITYELSHIFYQDYAKNKAKKLFTMFPNNEALPYLYELANKDDGEAVYMLYLYYLYLGEKEMSDSLLHRGVKLGNPLCMIALNGDINSIAEVECKANSGDVIAQFCLGMCNTIDSQQSLKHLKSAADNGFIYAEYLYGTLHEPFGGQYLDKAAEKGLKLAQAQKTIKMFINPFSSPLNEIAQTIREYIKDDTLISIRIPLLRKLIEILECDTSLTDHSKEKYECYLKIHICDPLDAEGNLDLAKCYYYGRGIGKDYDKAFSHLGKAKENLKTEDNISKNVLYYLGKCYLFGRGVPRSASRAEKYFKESNYYYDADKYLSYIYYYFFSDYATGKFYLEKYRSAEKEKCDYYPRLSVESYSDDAIDLPKYFLDEYAHKNLKLVAKDCPIYYREDKSKGDQIKRAKDKFGKYSIGDFVAFIDISLFKNGNDGILFMTDGIGFDCAFEKVFFKYEDIFNLELNARKTELIFHGVFESKGNLVLEPTLNGISINIIELKTFLEYIIGEPISL